MRALRIAAAIALLLAVAAWAVGAEERNAQRIAAGGYHMMGTTTKENRLTPGRLGDDRDWVAVWAGLGHVLALKRDGTLWA